MTHRPFRDSPILLSCAGATFTSFSMANGHPVPSDKQLDHAYGAEHERRADSERHRHHDDGKDGPFFCRA
jgi:hypothetical protein